MGAFGSFKVNEDIGHVVNGVTELGPLTAGTYEPTSVEEFEALAHLATVSVQAPGDAQSHVLVELLTVPDVVVVTAAAEGTSEPVLPEPPAAPPVPSLSESPASPASPLLSGEGGPAPVADLPAQGSPPVGVPAPGDVGKPA